MHREWSGAKDVEFIRQIPINARKFQLLSKCGMLRRTMAILKASDLFVLAPGGAISDWLPGLADGWLRQLSLAKASHVRNVFLLGAGIGPVHGGQSRQDDLRKLIASSSAKVSFRDICSLAQLGLSVPTAGWELGQDVVVGSRYLESRGERMTFNGEGWVGVNIAGIFHKKPWRRNRESLARYVSGWASLIRHIVLVRRVGVVTVHCGLSDAEFYATYVDPLLSQEVRSSENYRSRGYEGIDSALDLIMACKHIVASRLHATIVASVFGKNVLPVAYHEKMFGFLERVGYLGPALVAGDGKLFDENLAFAHDLISGFDEILERACLDKVGSVPRGDENVRFLSTKIQSDKNS